MLVAGLAAALGVARAGAAEPYPESRHPYLPSDRASWTYSVAGGAAAIDVTFDLRTELENGADFLDVKDGDGVAVAGSPFTGSSLAGRTLRVPGATVVVELRPDSSDPPGRSFWGFAITGVVPVAAAAPAIKTAALPAARVGSVYSVQLEAEGGIPPLTWDLRPPDELPRGLTLHPGGLLTGVPAADGETTFHVRVFDAENRGHVKALTLLVRPSGTASFLSSVLGVPAGDTLPVGIELTSPTQGLPALREALVVLAFDPTLLRYSGFVPGSAARPPAAQVLFAGTIGEGAFSTVLRGELGPSGTLGTASFRILGPLPATQVERERVAFLTLTRLETRDGEVLFRFPPTADAGFDQLVEQSADGRFLAPDSTLPLTATQRLQPWLTLDGRRSVDPLGRPLTYYWSREEGGVEGLSAPGEPVTRFTTDLPGIYRFRLQVKNGETFSAPARVTARLSSPGRHAPTARAAARDQETGRSTSDEGSALAVVVNHLIELDGRASTDADVEDKDSLTYRWSAGDLLSAAQVTAAAPTFAAARVGTFDLELVVTDRTGWSSRPARLRLSVRPDGRPEPRLKLAAYTGSSTEAGQELGDVAVPLVRPRSLEAGLLTTVTLKGAVLSLAGAPLTSYEYDWRVAAGPEAELPDSTASTVEVRLTTPGVYVLECVAREVEAGQTTGVTTTGRIRLVAGTTQVRVPLAEAGVTAAGVSKAQLPDRSTGGGQAAALHHSRDQLALLTHEPPTHPLDRRRWQPALSVSRPPALQLPSETFSSADIGDVVTLDGTGSRARSEGATVQSYRWVQVSGPDVVLSDPTSPVATFAAPDLRSDRAQALVFNLYVDDGRVRSEPAPVQVEVRPQPAALFSVTLHHGLNLIGLPSEPVMTDHLFRVSDLLSAGVAGFVARTTGVGGTRAKFEAALASLPSGADFVMEPARGYLLFNPGEAKVLAAPSARAWAAPPGKIRLTRGLHLLALGSAQPGASDAERLTRATGAVFVARLREALVPPARFEVYLPGGPGPGFAVLPGEGYVVGVSSAREVRLP